MDKYRFADSIYMIGSKREVQWNNPHLLTTSALSQKSRASLIVV